MQAYQRGFTSPKYMFITIGWYSDRWWQEGYSSDNYNCTAEDLEKVALYNIAAKLLELPDDPDAVAEPNIVSLSQRKYDNKVKIVKYVFFRQHLNFNHSMRTL